MKHTQHPVDTNFIVSQKRHIYIVSLLHTHIMYIIYVTVS